MVDILKRHFPFIAGLLHFNYGAHDIVAAMHFTFQYQSRLGAMENPVSSAGPKAPKKVHVESSMQ